jgi:hypothetical protein
MPINFPDSPAENDSFTSGGKKWIFNGTVWTLVTANSYTIPTGEVTTAKILDANVTAAKLASGAAVSNIGYTPANIAGPTFTGTVVLPSTTSIGTVTSTEIGYVDGVTSAIQTQLNTKAPTASPTFTGTVALPTTVASGVLTATAQPSFLATRSSNLSYTGGNPVVFNATTYNIGSHYSTSTGLFTAPVSGNYIFSASIYQTGFIAQLWFYINGARERTFVHDHNNTAVILAGSSVVYLSAGNTIGVVSWSDGGARTIYQQYEHTFFRGALIS